MTGLALPVGLLGAAGGAGLVLVVRGTFPPPPSLVRRVRDLDRRGGSVETGAHQGVTSRRHLLGRLGERVVMRLGSKTMADLAITGTEPAAYAVSKLATALALAIVVVGFAALLAFAGIVLPLGFTFLATLAMAAIGFVTPDIVLRTTAKARRDAFRHALSSYLDLVNVLLAGGAGIETALDAAAEAGDGWTYEQIRHSLLRSRTLRQSPWDCFEALGRRLAVTDLVEISASIRLAGEQGARVKMSLAAKAASLRTHQMARIEADADAATERLGLPTVLMFLGFMVLLGYPAMHQIVQAL